MALENGEVLQNLTNQLQEVTQQLNTLGETRVKLIGAIEVLQQIEETNNPAPVAEEAPEEVAPVEETPAEEAAEETPVEETQTEESEEESQMMRKNSSVDLSLFLLIAKIGKTRGLKGEFFLRSFAQNPEALFSFKKFYALSSSKMQEVQFEFMKQNNANIVAKLKSINDIDEIKAFGQKDIFILKSELPELEVNEAYWFELEGMQINKP